MPTIESAVQATVNIDLSNLRQAPRFVYERVPVERIEQYSAWRTMDQQRN